MSNPLKTLKQSLALRPLPMRQPGDTSCVLELDEIRSYEHFTFSDDSRKPRPVLDGIRFQVSPGEVWAVTGSDSYSIGLLLAIAAGIAPFESGDAVIMDRPMKRTKRLLLPDLFYLGTPDMIYKEFTVLEFLTFVTAKAACFNGKCTAERQKFLLDKLVELELGYIALTLIEYLSPAEKAVVTLLSVRYAGNSLVILNLPELEFTERTRNAGAALLREMSEEKQAVIFGIRDDSELIAKASTHIAVLGEGRIFWQGETDLFRRSFDKTAFTIRAPQLQAVARELHCLLPTYHVSLEPPRIIIRDLRAMDSPSELDTQYLLSQIHEAELWVESVRVHQKTVGDALREASRIMKTSQDPVTDESASGSRAEEEHNDL